jgi:uncharacterized protein
MSLIVIAKAPRAGLSKTRLSPPLSPVGAARVAEAALRDTLAVVTSTPGIRPVLALDGPPGAWLPPGLRVVAQRGVGLDERIAASFEEVGGPAMLIGMDTPQVTSALLSRAVGRLLTPGVDAVLGPAEDGGWWCIGLRDPDAAVFLGVPMSTPETGRHQRERLRALGLRTIELPVLRDIDVIEDVLHVAADIPCSHLSRALGRLGVLREDVAG